MNYDKKTFSIGALAQATGVPVETLRTWERRYGFPQASRTPTGHRRYASSAVERLRRVKLALDRGHKPSSVLELNEAELDHLLGWSGSSVPTGNGGSALDSVSLGSDLHPQVHSWLSYVAAGDVDSLERSFRLNWSALSAEDFLEMRAAPFMYEVGERWARGDLNVMQEHAASQRLRDFLAEQWRPIADRSHGLRIVCAALSGDQHDLGAHMTATILAVSGAKVIFLGADTPVVEMARAIAAFGAVGITISISRAVDGGRAYQDLKALRDMVPHPIPIITGGAGAPEPPEGVKRLQNLSQLADLMQTLSSPSLSVSGPRA